MPSSIRKLLSNTCDRQTSYLGRLQMVSFTLESWKLSLFPFDKWEKWYLRPNIPKLVQRDQGPAQRRLGPFHCLLLWSGRPACVPQADAQFSSVSVHSRFCTFAHTSVGLETAFLLLPTCWNLLPFTSQSAQFSNLFIWNIPILLFSGDKAGNAP